MTLILLFAAVLVAGAVAAAAIRQSVPGPSGGSPAGDVPMLAEPDPRLPPVLLPEHPDPADVEHLRLSVAPRGYRMDQVDEVLARLGRALAERDEQIARLAARPAAGPLTERGDRDGTA